jgi:hypothetical protein
VTARFNPDRDVAEWRGATIRYDLLKEVAICFVVVLVLVASLAVVFSSPDDRAVTLQSWSKASPVNFVQTAITELDATSGVATYGPPYNSATGGSQKLGPISMESAVGAHIHIDTAEDFVVGPLRTLPNQPTLDRALAAFSASSTHEKAAYEAAYETAVAKASDSHGLRVPAGDYGPVGIMMSSLLAMARSGALDGALTATPQLYGTDYTKPLLFIADGSYLADLAQARNLTGSQWGMMNETGNYPGQAWLWLYTFWYQVPPMSSSTNADVEVWAIMMALTLVLILLPFIPGLRSIPRHARIYRLIWRRHYRSLAT